MGSLAAPLHIGRLNDRPLRFFRAPVSGNQLPWHAWEDMQACLDLAPDIRAYFRRCLMEDWASDVRTVATSEGIVTIAPHWMAQGIIGAIGEIKGTEPTWSIAYTGQMVAAWGVLTGDMPASASMELLAVAIGNMLAEQRHRTTP